MEMNIRKNLGFQKLKDAYVKIVLYKHGARCLALLDHSYCLIDIDLIAYLIFQTKFELYITST